MIYLSSTASLKRLLGLIRSLIISRFLISLPVSIRRKALKPYTFANNGPHVPVGAIACAPAYEIMHNESKYPNPDTFDGLHFVKTATATASGPPDSPTRGTTFTAGNKDFPIWGLGSKIWYVPPQHLFRPNVRTGLRILVSFEYVVPGDGVPLSLLKWRLFILSLDMSSVLRMRVQGRNGYGRLSDAV